MSPQRKNSRQPPKPRPIARWIELGAAPIAAMVGLALLLILASSGVLLESGDAHDRIWRVVFVYVFLLLAFRLTGKREVGEMSPFELVTLLLIPEIFSSALNRSSDSLSLASVGVATLFLLVFFTGLVTFRSKKLEELLEGEPSILVRDGKYIERNLRRERVTPDEIFTEMHLSGIDRLEDVRWAILEVEGKISIIPKDAGAGQSGKKDEGGRV
jgi:uncharacterized membrane protein YcaP (DUF421 family)